MSDHVKEKIPWPVKEASDGVFMLRCDICRVFLAWVKEFDLNGSYFFCDECKKKYDIPEVTE